MDNITFETVLQSFLNLNLNTEQRIYKKSTFLDEDFEEHFRKESAKNSIRTKIYTDSFIVFSFLTTLIYIWVHKYKMMFAYVCLACLAVSLFLIAFSYYKRSSSFNKVINHAMIFLMSIFLNLKIIYIACCFDTEENDYDSEIIRTMIYDVVSKNIMCWIATDKRVSVTVVLYFFNLCAVIVAQMKSNSNHYYYLEALSGLVMTIFFFLLKKQWEAINRDNFSGKYRFEKLYNYSRDFIKG